MNKFIKKLRFVLIANLLFSLSSGIILIGLSELVSELMNVNSEIIVYVGVVLVLFSLLIGATAIKTSINKNKVNFIILQDWIWVFSSIVLLVFIPNEITIIGNMLIIIVGLIVASLAIFQSNIISKNNLAIKSK